MNQFFHDKQSGTSNAPRGASDDAADQSNNSARAAKRRGRRGILLTPKGRRLSADEEKDLAREIHRAEEAARRTIRGIDCAEEILRKKPKRVERTRAGMVDRIERAVEAVWEAAKEEPALRETARDAMKHWKEAENLRWNLAMSGKRIAYGEARKLSGPYLDEPDLVQEGYVGLLRAAKRFDPDRNIRFSTYARWWVRAQMTRAIDHTGRTVRLPGCAVEQTRNLRKAMKRMDAAGIEYDMRSLAKMVDLEPSRAEFLLAQGQTVSLDQPVEGGPRPRSVEQFLTDDEATDPDEDAILQQEIQKMLDALEEVLSERHRYVLTMRYGLEDNKFRTLSEVGDGMDLSRERVRQLEREALIMLREQADIRELV